MKKNILLFSSIVLTLCIGYYFFNNQSKSEASAKVKPVLR